jgi:tricorn protease-like protein
MIGMITISEPLPVKENIYTQLSSVRGMITISEPLPVKENIYTHICSLLQEVVLILLSFLSLMTAVYVLFYRKWF